MGVGAHLDVYRKNHTTASAPNFAALGRAREATGDCRCGVTMGQRHGGRIEPPEWPTRPQPEQTMPPTPRRQPRSCVEILDQLGEKASWDDFLATVAASSEINPDSNSPAEAPSSSAGLPGGIDAGESDADQIATLRHRLGLD